MTAFRHLPPHLLLPSRRKVQQEEKKGKHERYIHTASYQFADVLMRQSLSLLFVPLFSFPSSSASLSSAPHLLLLYPPTIAAPAAAPVIVVEWREREKMCSGCRDDSAGVLQRCCCRRVRLSHRSLDPRSSLATTAPLVFSLSLSHCLSQSLLPLSCRHQSPRFLCRSLHLPLLSLRIS